MKMRHLRLTISLVCALGGLGLARSASADEINQPPPAPAAPVGPTSGLRNTPYEFVFTFPVDPDGDPITSYVVEWGDGSRIFGVFPTARVLLWTPNGFVDGAWLQTNPPSMMLSHVFGFSGVYNVRFQVSDIHGAASPWTSLAVEIRNQAPQALPAPAGPSYGDRLTTYRFSTGTATDPDGDPILAYAFDWGDGTTSTMYLPGTYVLRSGNRLHVHLVLASPGNIVTSPPSSTHRYARPGTYNVRVRAMDFFSTWSDWSPAASMRIVNQAPATPTIPEGPSLGRHARKAHPHRTYTYTASALDPEGDAMSLVFDWGDGSTTTTAPVASGAPASAAHRWRHKGVYAVQIYALDSFGGRSPLSSARQVVIK